jgi:hypothetical protein
MTQFQKRTVTSRGVKAGEDTARVEEGLDKKVHSYQFSAISSAAEARSCGWKRTACP